MTRFAPLLALALWLWTPAALAQSCTAVWDDARQRMADECNDDIASNTMCFAYPPLATDPVYTGFSNIGDLQAIDTDLNAITANSNNGSGGFFWLKIIAERDVEGFRLGQAIIVVAFGDSAMQQMESLDQPLEMGRGKICEARLKRGSTTFGGSYVRATPDPRFQVECVRFPCEDKNNLLYFAEEGQRLDVLGRSADAESLLVTTLYATGWITASARYMQLEGCSISDLPVASDTVVLDALALETDLEVIREFRLINRPNAYSIRCIAQDRPPGGLLILNPTHQAVQFSTNSISISLASAVLLTSHGAVTRVFVLQGTAQVTTADGATITGQSGDVIAVVSNVPPVVLRSEGQQLKWCEALSKLARAALGADPDRVPFERLNYCDFAPTGYPVGRREVRDMLAKAGVDSPIGLILPRRVQ